MYLIDKRKDHEVQDPIYAFMYIRFMQRANSIREREKGDEPQRR